MKTNHLAVLPAIIRRDKLLSSSAKLLWAEISAASDEYGVCSEKNEVFAEYLNIETRTVIRCINQLIDNGHLVRLDDNHRRKLKVILKSIPLPEDTTITEVKTETYASIEAFTYSCLALWEEKLGTTLADKQQYLPMFLKVLKTFSEEEVLKAVKNRIHYVTHTEWFLQPENSHFKNDINTLFESDTTFLRYINK